MVALSQRPSAAGCPGDVVQHQQIQQIAAEAEVMSLATTDSLIRVGREPPSGQHRDSPRSQQPVATVRCCY